MCASTRGTGRVRRDGPHRIEVYKADRRTDGNMSKEKGEAVETDVAAAQPREFTPETDKGLKGGALGLVSSVVIGVSSTAPAYSLAASLGFVAMVAGMGNKSPAIIIVAFIPMLLIAGAYYYLNKVDPDCGTTFMWTVRSFGPHLGWVTGWVMVAADIIVMASLAQITGTYFFLLFGLDSFAESTFWVTLVGVVFLVIMTIITALGIELAAEIQWGLLGVEFVILVVFSVVALIKVYGGGIADSVTPQWEWFSPFGLSGSTLAGGVLLALFIYWGWDTAVSVNEETEQKNRVPGMAAVISTFLLVGIYLLATTAAQAVHGPAFLVENADDVLSPLGTDVLGSWVTKALIFAVLTSATASTMTTILPGARTTLSMATHGAIPKIFSRMSARYQTPVWSTGIYGALSVLWYVGSHGGQRERAGRLHRRSGPHDRLLLRHERVRRADVVPAPDLFEREELPSARVLPHPRGARTSLGVRAVPDQSLGPRELRIGYLLVRSGATLHSRGGVHPLGRVGHVHRNVQEPSVLQA